MEALIENLAEFFFGSVDNQLVTVLGIYSIVVTAGFVYALKYIADRTVPLAVWKSVSGKMERMKKMMTKVVTMLEN